MAKFDLKGMLSERSTKEMDIPEQKTVYRNPEDLIPSEDNFYSTEDTEKLKQSIKCLGILQPLLIENRDGKDYIIAGHSRRKCCLELIEEGEERFRKVPCVYKPKIELPGEEDEIIRKILIIQSNTYREKSDWEKMMESLKMESLVKELREKTELEGKTREIVSDLIGVSSTQIGRYHSISSNLSERLMEAFKQSRLNISTAAELAGLNEKYQAEACKILEETGQVTLNAAKLLKAQQEQERELPGQMTIEEALHPAKPQEIDTVIPVDIQIDRFYESLRKKCRDLYPSIGPEYDHLHAWCPVRISTCPKRTPQLPGTERRNTLQWRLRSGRTGSVEGFFGTVDQKIRQEAETSQDSICGRGRTREQYARTGKMYHRQVWIRTMRSSRLLRQGI